MGREGIERVFVAKKWFQRLAAFLMLLSLLGTARAERRRPDDTTKNGLTAIAVVDMSRLYNQSEAPKEYEKRLAEVNAAAQQRLKIVSEVPQLLPENFLEFILLIEKEQPTEADTKRIQELQAASGKRQEEYRILQGKADLTPAEKTRLQSFVDAARTFQNQLLPEIAEGFRQSVGTRLDAFRSSQMAQIRTVVGQVAKQKGITHVFDATALIYCENDLTEAVLLRLKKKK